jgi:hypothetical protein
MRRTRTVWRLFSGRPGLRKAARSLTKHSFRRRSEAGSMFSTLTFSSTEPISAQSSKVYLNLSVRTADNHWTQVFWLWQCSVVAL